MRQAILLSTLCSASLLIATGASAQATRSGGGGMQQQQSQAPPSQTAPDRQMQDARMGPADANQNATHVDDKKFLKDAAEGGLMEVELGKVAVQKASDPQVKQFAQMMIDDHTKANEQLQQVAKQDGVQVPDSLDSKHQSKLDKMSKLSGEQFDKAYAKDQLKDHEKDVREFSNEAQGGSDPNVKAFASKTLPILQQHLEHAKSLNKNEKQVAKNQ